MESQIERVDRESMVSPSHSLHPFHSSKDSTSRARALTKVQLASGHAEFVITNRVRSAVNRNSVMCSDLSIFFTRAGLSLARLSLSLSLSLSLFPMSTFSPRGHPEWDHLARLPAGIRHHGFLLIPTASVISGLTLVLFSRGSPILTTTTRAANADNNETAERERERKEREKERREKEKRRNEPK